MSFWNTKPEKWDVKPESAGPEAPAPASQPPAEPSPAPVAAEPARSEPVARAEPQPPAREAAPRADLRLGRGVRLEGKLTFSGTVRIDATFQGSIVTDGVLVVGEQAKVDAEIRCGSVVIEGELNGNVFAKDAVDLKATALLRGDVESPALTIERGARFQGASRPPGAKPSGKSSAGGKAAAAPA